MENKKIEQSLLEKLPQGLRDKFKTKLRNNYWDIISEIRAVALFFEIGVPVVGIDIPTNKDKEVDFVLNHKGEEIYCEVKSSRLVDNEMVRRGGIETLEKNEDLLDRALRRSLPKFIENEYNIIIIADQNTIRTSLYRDFFIEMKQTPQRCFDNFEYKKISALVILGEMNEKDIYKYKVCFNTNAGKELPLDFKSILKQKTEYLFV